MSTEAPLLPDPSALPDDPAVLKALVVQLLEELQKVNARLARQEHHMHLLLKKVYGRTSEKFDPRQGMLFDPDPGEEEPEPSTPASAGSEEASASSSRAKARDRHGRGRIPDEVAREEVVHDLTDAEKAALGGVENLVALPPDRSEQLDWRPSTLFVTVHVRKKYARKQQLPESGLTFSEQNVVVARKPPEAIPGGLAGPGLMSQVIVSKGADHLPLYRLEGIFKRQGGLSRVPAGGRLQRIRRDLSGIRRPNHRGRLLGPCAAKVPREPAARFGSDANGAGMDRQALRGGDRLA